MVQCNSVKNCKMNMYTFSLLNFLMGTSTIKYSRKNLKIKNMLFKQKSHLKFKILLQGIGIFFLLRSEIIFELTKQYIYKSSKIM